MDQIGNSSYPTGTAAIEAAIARILCAGKAPGILTTDAALAQWYLALGAVFVAVGLDTAILVRGTTELVARFKGAAGEGGGKAGGY
jgi:4-hydroxy-2-oxoheptanedioate aldolase